VETSPNNYADPHDFFYQLHHFPSEQKYEAWLTEHFDADAIDTDALDGLPRPQLLHEGAMGEEQAVEVLMEHFSNDVMGLEEFEGLLTLETVMPSPEIQAAVTPAVVAASLAQLGRLELFVDFAGGAADWPAGTEASVNSLVQ
ncbi:MAG: hypothetical protein IIA03_03565, partial [Proteobacteria bacterium]|nr:hypothetical protein [Pseudomonadota bacterium]